MRSCETRGVAAALALLVWLALGCGPWGPQGVFAGGPFLGATNASFPSDWSFSDAHPLVSIETRGALFRHSVTILCVAADGKLYVMARHAPRKRWVQNLGGDPQVRLRVGEDLFAGRAVRIGAGPEGDAVARAFLRKYVGIEVEAARPLQGPPAADDDHAEVWTWRIDPPEAGA
jgi:hypothetical protein